MIDSSMGPWLMPLGIAVVALILGTFRPAHWLRFVVMLWIGILAAVAVDLAIRGIPLVALGSSWNWLIEVFASALLAAIAAVTAGGLATLVSRALRGRTT